MINTIKIDFKGRIYYRAVSYSTKFKFNYSEEA